MNVKYENTETLKKWYWTYKPFDETWLNNSPYTIKTIKKELKRRGEL